MAAVFRCFAIALGFLGASVYAAEMFPFVLPWDDASPSATNLSGWLEKPAGAQGFIAARDGHLFAGEKRIRFFGVNLAFGANFPTHGDAEKVAARMAKFGINCVRFHHMDTATAPAGLLQKDRRTLDPVSLEKLDYFIAQLKQNGIYGDLNLHVGNPYPGMPSWENSTSYFKGVDNFYPPMIESQHEYARALLTHVNPYTGLAYTADPAVAFIEINNENGLVMEWNNGTLDYLPEPLSTEFTRQWNAWLKQKYGSEEKLMAAWKEGAQPLGAELLQNADFTSELTGWQFERHEGAKATIGIVTEGATRSLAVQVEKPGAETWHVQLSQGGLKVEGGKTYTVAINAKADRARTVSVALSQAHEPWKVLASAQVRIRPEWGTTMLRLSSAASESKARLVISGFGAENSRTEFAEISVRPGGVVAQREKEEPGHIGFFHKDEIAWRTLAAQRDWTHFLYDTEAAYWPGMMHFLKDELGARSLVLGSATGFSPWPVQAMLDVVDAHAYWQHPSFPHRQWDMGDWVEKNLPMAGAEDGGTLPGLALRRVAGKPFIVTEYNHASPNTYSGEAFLEVCAMAARQDWDGVFAFAYCHRTDDWGKGYFPSFFDIDQHPTKMATLPAALALFLRGDLTSANAATKTAGTTLPELLESIRKGSSWVDGRALGLTKEETFQHAVSMQIGPSGQGPEPAVANPGQLIWDTEAKQMRIVSPRSVGVVGTLAPGKPVQLGPVVITAGQTRQKWGSINVTVLEGDDFAHARRWLITATGETGNTGMKWTDETHTSVGSNWGRAPSLVEGLDAMVTFFVPGPVHAWALDGKGQRGQSVSLPLANTATTPEGGGTAVLQLSPAHQTLWWEVARE